MSLLLLHLLNYIIMLVITIILTIIPIISDYKNKKWYVDVQNDLKNEK